MKHFISFLLLFTLSVLDINAQDNYNIQRAFECINEHELDNAEKYLQKELEANKKSVQALDLLGYILTQKNDYGRALLSLNNAVKYANRKDKEALHMAFYHRAALHTVLRDTTAAINDYKKALHIHPGNRQCLVELGDLYFELKEYALSDDVYRRMISENEGDPYPFYGLARNAYTQGDYTVAETAINQALLIDSDEERVHTLKMRLYILQEKYPAALEESIETMAANHGNTEAYQALMSISDTIKEQSINRVVKESFMHPEDAHWKFILSHLYIRHRDYDSAIGELEHLLEGNSEYQSLGLYWTAYCYEKLGMYSQVIEYISKAIAIDQEEPDFYMMRADARFSLQDLEEAKADYMKMMEIDKDYGYFGYYRIGWIQEMKGQYSEALKSYNLSIALNDAYAYTFLMKGNLLRDYLNDGETAELAFRKCIELDEGIGENTCKQYAYLALGDTLKAIAVSDSILTTYQDPGSYYDAACLYSRMNQTRKAVKYLRTAFEKGFRKINHAKKDDDLNNIRNDVEFKNLIRYYENKISSPGLKQDVQTLYTDTVEVPLRSDGAGSYYVTCKANNFPMEFMLDTGCSDISISSTESNYMKKHGILKDGDFLGEIKYKNASGEIKSARQINIKAFKIGGFCFTNVKASIVDNDDAPLLLGQNILSKFGKIEIDHKKNRLKIFTIDER